MRYESRDYYLGKYGSPEAARAYAKLLTQLAAGLPPARRGPDTPLSVAGVASAWLEGDAPRYGGSAEAGQFDRALAVLVRLYADLPAADFRARHLDAVRLAMASGSWMTDAERDALRRDRSPGWCRNVVNRQTVRLRTVWRWAEREGLVPEGSWAHLRTLPGLKANDGRARATAKRKAAAWADVLAVVKRCEAPVRAMLLTQWWSGCRSGEVRTMRRGDLDRSGPVWVYRPRLHKTAHLGQTRVVALGRRCQAALRAFVEAAPDDDAYLFVPPPGGRPGAVAQACYSRKTYSRAVRRAARRAGVGLVPYQLRHAAKDRVTRHFGLDAARAVLGQSSLAVANSYGEAVDLKSAEEVARRLG